MTDPPPVPVPRQYPASATTDAGDVEGVLSCVCGGENEFAGGDDVAERS